MSSKPIEPEVKAKQPPALGQLEPVERERFERLRRIGLPVALGISVGVALLLTSVSIGLYFSSNLSRIDLSKPKYADIRRDVKAAGGEEFKNEGPVTQEAVQEAMKELKQSQAELRELGDFTSSVLDDEQLGITPVE